MRRALPILLAVQLAAIALYVVVEARRARPPPPAFFVEPLRAQPSLGDEALTRLDGSPLRLREVATGPALLHGWATWCAPCVVELPKLRAFAAREGLQLVAITDEPAPTVARFFDGAVPDGFLLDPDGALARRAGLSARPETLLLDEEQVPLLRMAGARDWAAAEASAALRR